MIRRVIEVEWEDHAFHGGQHTGLNPDLGLSSQVSTGYFVDEDNAVIKLMQTVTDGKDAGEVLVIDKRMVKRVRTVRRGRKT